MADSKSYQQLRKELDELISWFEGPEVEIDQAIDKYKQAIKVSKQIETYLDEAQNKITKL